MRADFPQFIYTYLYRSRNTGSSGYDPELATGKNIDLPPNPNDPAEVENFKDNRDFALAPARLENLRSIVAINREEGTRVLIVEMPVHPTFYVYVGGDTVHRQFQQTISSIISSNGGAFLPAEKCMDIPLAGRANRWHLNYVGAPIFSTCLGQQLTVLAGQQKTDFIRPEADGLK